MPDYQTMSKAEAQQLLTQWLAHGDQRLKLLARQLGPTDAGLLDRSVNSLLPMWAAVRQQLSWRPDSEPVDPDRLPLWYEDHRGIGYSDFSDETLWLIDAAAYYYGEVLRIQSGGVIDWGVGRNRRKNYIDQNRVILKRGDDPVINPKQMLCVQTARALRADPMESETALRDHAGERLRIHQMR